MYRKFLENVSKKWGRETATHGSEQERLLLKSAFGMRCVSDFCSPQSSRFMVGFRAELWGCCVCVASRNPTTSIKWLSSAAVGLRVRLIGTGSILVWCVYVRYWWENILAENFRRGWSRVLAFWVPTFYEYFASRVLVLLPNLYGVVCLVGGYLIYVLVR